MDPILPYRALSPGTRKPKTSHRNRDTKLSLKSHMMVLAGKNKENYPPASVLRRDMRKRTPVIMDSDLMTSDESDSSDPGCTLSGRQKSTMSLNTQDSMLSLPVAESTRCDVVHNNLTRQAESTTATLHTARSGSSSSTSTEYFTACPVSVSCNESIVCILDSSPESTKQEPRKITMENNSALLTSDESDCESRTKHLHDIVATHLRKNEAMKMCDTIVLESSDSDIDSVVEPNVDCSIVIPPSTKSCGDESVSSSESIEVKSSNDLLVVPQSPEISENIDESLISEDGFIGEKSYKCKEAYQRINKSNTNNNGSNELAAYQGLDPVLSGNRAPDHKLEESSWKEDFHLVMQDSSGDCGSSKQNNLPLGTPVTTGRTISKAKYNDIAKWLFSGNDFPSESPASTDTNEKNYVKPVESVMEPISLKHPQVSRLSVVRRSSFGSESDDNFEALMKSIREKRYDTDKKNMEREILCKGDGSFIDDGCASDVVESPSFNMYHSDLTKSIRAEVKSVQRSVKSLKKKQIFRPQYDSDEDSDKEKEIHPAKDPTKVNQWRRRLSSSEDSDSVHMHPKNYGVKSISDSCVPERHSLKSNSSKDISDSDEDAEDANLAPVQTPITAKDRKNTAPKKIKKPSWTKSSDSDSSDSEAPIQSRRPMRRKASISASSSESSSSSKSPSNNLVTHPKSVGKQDFPRKQVPKSVKGSFVTPKRITSLKSPFTPSSPIRTFLSSLSGPTHEPGIRDHPEAAVYNKNFKGKKEELTRRLFKLFNREVFDRRLPDDMVLEWNARLVRTAGLCYCKLITKGGVTSRTAKIALSTKVITSPDRLRDTLIHEMCHSAVWLLNNVSGGHGPFWKDWAHKAMKRFPELPPIERCHSYNIETKFTYKCTKCGYSFGRHSKSLDLDKKRCGYCYGKFEVFLTSKGQNNHQNMLKTPKAPSSFALFVKDNYGLIKQENGHFKHGDIMKKLGEKFSSMKMKSTED